MKKQITIKVTYDMDIDNPFAGMTRKEIKENLRNEMEGFFGGDAGYAGVTVRLDDV